MEEERVIRVTGRGMLRLTPDTTCVSITLRGSSKDYAQALERSARDTETLKDLLEGLGFDRSELRTTALQVDTKYENYKEGGAYRQRLVGYEFVHGLKLKFPSDNALLGRVLRQLAHSPVTPELRFGYTVRDEEAAKNRLLAAAVEDAKAKAEVLARAAGETLGRLQRIDYSRGELDIEVHPMPRAMKLACAEAGSASYDMDIQPEDIEVTDTVTLVWELG